MFSPLVQTYAVWHRNQDPETKELSQWFPDKDMLSKADAETYAKLVRTWAKWGSYYQVQVFLSGVNPNDKENK